MANEVKRIRGRRHQAIRQAFLRAHPLCKHCEERGIIREATDVDHIKPITHGGTETDDNRQSLCKECHRIKTAKDMGWHSKPKVVVGDDGWPKIISSAPQQ